MHDHSHPHAHPHSHHGHSHAPGPGHNAPGIAQWQTPHAPDAAPPVPESPPEPDFDLVEQAFAQSFPVAVDPTSFLRLAGVPFVGERADGSRLFLLRVEQDETTDVGSVTPGLGNAGFRYAPMPQRLVSRRRRLAFVYFDGEFLVRLDLAEARGLKDHSQMPDTGQMAAKPLA